jgi:hypothetical protein
MLVLSAFSHWKQTARTLLVVALLLAALGLLAALPRTASAAEQALVYATVRATPGVQIVPSQTLTYTLTVKNVGDADANSANVILSYDTSQLALLGARFEDNKDWVRAIENVNNFRQEITVTFSDVNEGSSRSAHLLMQVKESVPHGIVIKSWARYNWVDAAGLRRDKQMNAVPVLAAPNSAHSDFVWMDVSPAVAPAGTSRLFVSDRFMPGENVNFWINLPDGGQMPLPDRALVDENGRFDYRLKKGLPSGTYQMVAHGMRSDLMAVSDFTVQ